MDREVLEELALAVRQAIVPGLSPLAPVPLNRLTLPCGLPTRTGNRQVRVRRAPMPPHVWGLTTFGVDLAWIWLNLEAWPELPRGIPRTRFTVAHELGHVVLHGDELEGLDEPPEGDHAEVLERQANRFAAHLLIPDAALKRLSTRGPPVEALASQFGVSAMAAQRRWNEWQAG